MAKKVPYGIMYGGKSIRTLTDLKENFFILDIYVDYKSGELQKWLEHCGYSDEVNKLKNIDDSDALLELEQLCKVFGKEYEKNECKLVIELYNDRKYEKKALWDKVQYLQKELEQYREFAYIAPIYSQLVDLIDFIKDKNFSDFLDSSTIGELKDRVDKLQDSIRK